jgi:hypothetical protein
MRATLDEPIALLMNPSHHRAAVHTDGAVDPETRRSAHGVSYLCGGDEELARYAADTRAGRALRAALDEHDALRGLGGRLVSGEARRSGA